MRALFSRLRSLWRRDVIADEIREEYEFHLAMRIEELVNRGATPAEAERRVRRRFGNLARLRDEGYDIRGGGIVEAVERDIRHGVRVLRRSPAYALSAVLTLALGVGLIASLAAVIDVAWLRPLPFEEPDRIVEVRLTVESPDGERRSLEPSAHDLMRLRRSPALAAVGAYVPFDERPVLDDGSLERVRALSASPGYFEAHGVRTVLGRSFGDADARPGAASVIVLGHAFWRQRFAGDPGVIGRRVTLDGQSAEVVGVAPADFHRRTQVWRALANEDDHATRRGGVASAVAQLPPGTTVASATAALAEVVSLLPDDPMGRVRGAVLTPVYADLLERTRDAIVFVAAAVSFLVVLLVVNVSGLVFAHWTSRRQEIAVRASLGAGRVSLMRQQLVEAAMLAAAACAVGLLLAHLSLDVVLAALPLELPPHGAPTIDVRIVAFTIVTGGVSALVVALWPAWRLTAVKLRDWLSGRAVAPARRWFRRPGQVLVFAQVTLAAVLLVAGGLLVRSIGRMLDVDLGFQPRTVQVFEVTPADPDPGVWASFYPALVQRLRSVPGIAAVGAGDWIPLSEMAMFLAMDARNLDLLTASVTPGFLEAVGVPLRLGRLLADADAGQPVVVISEAAARELMRADASIRRMESLIGRTVDLSGPQTIVGIVGDLRGWGARAKPQAMVYSWLVPHAFMPPTVIVRAAGPPISAQTLATVAQSIGPRVVIDRVRPGLTLLDDNVRTPRQRTALVVMLASVGLALALVGIAGVTAQTVASRTREVGVRMAFGATSGQVVRSIAGDTMMPTLLGLLTGTALAIYLSRFATRFLFETAPTDPVALMFVMATVIIAGLLVSWIPARRAARVDPVVALRAE